MSDEDRDIDIESDEDDELGGAAATQFMTQAEKRAHHNALERKRRDHIKDSFHNLRDSVPNLQGEKVSGTKRTSASRAMILKQATEYITFMTKKNGSVQTDIEDLKRQTQILEQQVRALEKAKSTGQFAAQSTMLQSSPTFDDVDGLDPDSDESDSSLSQISTGSKRKRLKTDS